MLLRLENILLNPLYLYVFFFVVLLWRPKGTRHVFVWKTVRYYFHFLVITGLLVLVLSVLVMTGIQGNKICSHTLLPDNFLSYLVSYAQQFHIAIPADITSFDKKLTTFNMKSIKYHSCYTASQVFGGISVVFLAVLNLFGYLAIVLGEKNSVQDAWGKEGRQVS